MIGASALVPAREPTDGDMDRYDALIDAVEEFGNAWSAADGDRAPARSCLPRV